MGPVSSVDQRPFPIGVLTRRLERERLAVRMLRVPHRPRHTVLKANKVVLPVAYMVAQLVPQYDSAPVKRPEIHIKRIYHTAALVDRDNRTRLLASGTAGGIRLYAVQPCGVRSNLRRTGQICVLPIFSPDTVQLVEIS
jgi:hypothetical protein